MSGISAREPALLCFPMARTLTADLLPYWRAFCERAGSDLTALRTTATRDGGSYLVNGEKLFITNVVPGRMVGLVCLVEGKPAVLIVDLPAEENEQFQLRKYGLWALKHTYNRGMIFNNCRVPAENLLVPPRAMV